MDTMILEFFLVFVLGLVIGWRISQAMDLIAFRKILQELGITDQQMRELAHQNGLKLEEPQETLTESQLPVVEIKIEEHSGVLFAFRKDNDQFLGQGPDRDALIKRLTENLTNVRVVVAKEDGGDHLMQKNS